MSQRVYNFSAGPAVLPLSVLQRAQKELVSLPGLGMSVLEISHRSAAFGEILAEAEANLRKLLSVPDEYKVIFLQGGSRLQFSMIPMNMIGGTASQNTGPQNTGRSADYLVTGSWGQKAIEQARLEGDVRVAYDGESHNFSRLPSQQEMDLNAQAAYVHYTSNETIQGVQFPSEPDVGDVPLVCDASSDFFVASDRHEASRIDLCMCPKERRSGGRYGRNPPRGHVTACARRPERDARLSQSHQKQLALQHPAGIRHLRDEPDCPMVARRHGRT